MMKIIKIESTPVKAFHRVLCLTFFTPLLFISLLQGQTYNLGQQLMPGDTVRPHPLLVPQQNLPLVSNCENSNFSLGTWKGWSACYGVIYEVDPPGPIPPTVFLQPCNTPGFEPTRHVLIPAPGTLDPHTCSNLVTVFPGEAFSARLGDYDVGGHAEQLRYSIAVNAESYLFVYRYAVILESPNHTLIEEQPGFKVEIQDSVGVVIDSTCGLYEVYSPTCTPDQPGCIIPPNWSFCNAAGSGTLNGTYWRNWTTVGMNLTSYLGHTISIVFTTHGCAFTAHRGYAYISAYCSYLTMQTAMCQGDTSAILTAPPGFGYFWHTVNGDTTINGDTTSSIVVPHPTTGSTYNCTLTAVNGCQVTISQTLTYTVIHSNFTFGSTCSTLPVVFQDSSYVNQNSVVGWRWNFGDGTTIVTGTPTPTHSFALPGTYNVKLVSFSTEGCRDSITKVVQIDTLPNVSNTPLNKFLCSKTGTNINLTSSVSGTLFTWTADSKNGTTTGFSNSIVPGTSINQTLNNTGVVLDTVTYHITPHKNTCDGVTVNYKVKVKPLPVLTNPVLTKSICDSTSTNITLTSNNDSTKFTWVCTASSVNLTGYSNNTTTPATLINQTIDNTGYNVDTVFYHIVPGSFGCTADTVIYKVVVYPSSDLSNTPKTKSICTNNSTNIILTSNVPGTLFTWNANGSSGNVTGFSNNATPTITLNQLLTNSGNAIEMVTYHITPHAHGCDGKITNYVVTVNPTPLLSNLPAITTQCSNLLTNITLNSNVTGTLFTWNCTPSSGNITGFSNNLIPTALLAQTLINSGNVLETVTYHITPHANGCDGTVTDYLVKVYPQPLLTNNPATKMICKDEFTNVNLTSNVAGTLFTWICTPSSGNVTGYSDNLIPTAFLNQALFNSGIVAETVTYHLTPHANSCDGAVADFIVTVNPKPYLTNNPMNRTICSGQSANLTLTASCPGTLFVWTAQLVSGNVTGFSNGTGNLINQSLTNTLSTPGQVKYIISPSVGPCTGNDTNYILTINPDPLLLNAPLNKQICNNTATGINLTSDVTGTLFTWTATGSSVLVSGFSDNLNPTTTLNQTLVNSGYTSETVTYHITPHANGCDGAVYDFVVTLFPTPNLSNTPLSKQQCNNQSTGIALNSNVALTLFTWTASGSSLLVTGYSDNLIPLSTINQTLANSGNSIETVTYHITPHANGCNGIVYNYIVTVYPTPQITTAPLAQSICTNTLISVNLASSVANSTFAWISAASSPNLAGYMNGNGNLISQTLSNSGYTIETVTYHITPTANGCSGPVSNYVVTVNPKPDVSNNPLSSQICSGLSPMINLTSNVAGVNFTWTASGSSGNIIGYGPGSGLVINQILTNLGLNIETVTYHITPSANGCTGNAVDFVVTIVSTPDVYFNPSSQTICNAQKSNIQILSHVSNSTFTWTALGSMPQVTGYSNGSGNLIAQTIFNSGNTIESVTYTATPTAFGCPPGIPQNVVLTVNPKPAVTNTVRNFQGCSGMTTNIAFQSSVSGSTYNWTCSASSPNLAGFSNGAGNILSQILTNTGFTIETVTYVVTPTANSCSGDTAHFQVTVFPVADVYYTPPSQAICPIQTTNITIQSHVAGATFAWTATGSSGLVTGFSAGSGSLVQQTLNNSGSSIETVTYHTTPVANGCTGTTNNVVVTINLKPTVDLLSCWDVVTTTNSKPIRLKGGTPLNGVYSGTGVSAGIFYPAISSTGTFTINYGFSNSYSCSGIASQTISVISSLPFFCGDTLKDVRDNKTYTTIPIGTQCWMAANLDYGNQISGTLTQRDNCISEKFCFNNTPGNCSSNGGLYQWDEIMQYNSTPASQGFCPPEWHIPTEAEWGTLFNFYISNGFAGNALKNTGFSGYNAFLYGSLFKNVNWNFFDFATLFWSSTPRGDTKAWAHGMNEYNPSVSYYPGSRLNAFSVRCLKD